MDDVYWRRFCRSGGDCCTVTIMSFLPDRLTVKIARSQQDRIAKLLLLILPLGISAAWGNCFSDAAFSAFNQARLLASTDSVTGVIGQIKLADPFWLAHSPVFLLLLTGLARLDWLLPDFIRLLSGLGWGVTAVAVYTVGRGIKRPLPGFIAGLLIALSSPLLPGLGTAVSWTTAWVWLALAQAVRHPKRPPWLFLFLLFLTWLGVDSLIFGALLCLFVQFSQQRWAQMVGFLLFAMSALGVILGQSDGFGPVVSYFVQYNQFLWLLLPLVTVGLLAVFFETQKHPVLIAALVWPIVALLGGAETAVAALAILGFFLIGSGLARIVEWFQDRDFIRLKEPGYGSVLLVLLAVPFLAIQLVVLQQDFQQRPVTQARLERQVGEWLNVQTTADVTLLAEPAVAFWAGRTAVARLNSEWGAGTAVIPDYIVLNRHIAADQLVRTNWFQGRYETLTEFTSPYFSASPYTVWGYRSTIYDLGQGQPLNVRASDVVQIVGYQLEPERILPGEAVTVTLHMKLLQSLSEPIQATLRLAALPDGQIVAQSEPPLLTAQGGEQWPVGTLITEQLTLATPPDLPVGAYTVNFSLGQESEIWPLYRNNDANMLDRVTLGETAVSWPGELGDALPSRARFGEAVRLAAFAVVGQPQRGEMLTVQLYWEAMSQPAKSYVVFVHLLDEAGNLVSSHDSRPRDGRFPTNTWRSGDLIQDNHPLQLDAGLPDGVYQLNVGLYLPETGERLPVQTAEGGDIPAQSLTLTTITVR